MSTTTSPVQRPYSTAELDAKVGVRNLIAMTLKSRPDTFIGTFGSFEYFQQHADGPLPADAKPGTYGIHTTGDPRQFILVDPQDIIDLKDA